MLESWVLNQVKARGLPAPIVPDGGERAQSYPARMGGANQLHGVKRAVTRGVSPGLGPGNSSQWARLRRPRRDAVCFAWAESVLGEAAVRPSRSRARLDAFERA